MKAREGVDVPYRLCKPFLRRDECRGGGVVIAVQRRPTKRAGKVSNKCNLQGREEVEEVWW